MGKWWNMKDNDGNIFDSILNSTSCGFWMILGLPGQDSWVVSSALLTWILVRVLLLLPWRFETFLITTVPHETLGDGQKWWLKNMPPTSSHSIYCRIHSRKHLQSLPLHLMRESLPNVRILPQNQKFGLRILNFSISMYFKSNRNHQ